MMKINDIIKEVNNLPLVVSSDSSLSRAFITKQLNLIKGTLKRAGECLGYGREEILKKDVLENINFLTKD